MEVRPYRLPILCRRCFALTFLHHWTITEVAQRTRSLVCTTAAHCLATSRAAIRRCRSRRARMPRQRCWSTVAARAHLLAERRREQRKARAPMVKSLSRIWVLDVLGWTRVAGLVSVLFCTEFSSGQLTEMCTASQCSKTGLQGQWISAGQAICPCVRNVLFVLIHNALVDSSISEAGAEIVQM